MSTFNVEVIHEPTGTYMNFEAELEDFDPEEPISEEDAWQYILDDLSIVVNKVEE